MIVDKILQGGQTAAYSWTPVSTAGFTLPLLHLGLPDSFVEHGDPALLLAECGLDAAGLEASVRARLADSEA